MSMDLTAATAALKQHYSPDQVLKVVYKNNPLYTLIKKRKDAFGSSFELPIITRDPVGQNATFATAQTNAGNSSSTINRFALTPKNDYSLAVIDGDVIERSKGKENTFVELLANEVDGAMRQLTRSLSIAMYKKGYGARGVIKAGSSVTGTTLTLSNKGDARNFEVGMIVVFASAEDSGALRNSGGTLTVNAVDRLAGTLTMSGNVNSVTGTIAGDYVFQAGERNDSATPSLTKLVGLSGWVPPATPGSTSFFGVDRSVDTRLGGNRFDATGYTIEEALIEAGALVSAEGGSPDYCILSPLKFANFAKALTSRTFIDIETDVPDVGFRGIEFVNGTTGTVKVMADPNCPDDAAYLLQMDTWELLSAGEPVHMIENDGLTIRASATADKFEVRMRSIAQMGCRAPGWNCVVTNL